MELKQIANLINTQITPNTLGKDATIAEDLSNIVDIGTKVADLTADQLKDLSTNFVAGIAKTYFDTRRFIRSDLGLFVDSQDYGGVVQSVKAKMLETRNTPIWTLENGRDYFDGRYYGIEVDNKIYQKDTAYQIVNSIPVEMFKQSFTGRGDMMAFTSLIETTVENTVDFNTHNLAKRVLCMLGLVGREVRLLTTYNTLTNQELTPQGALQNADFLRWCSEIIIQLKSYITDYAKKYNDGTIETFTPSDYVKVTTLKIFDTALQFNMQADTFHNELVSIGDYNTVNFWQNSGDMIIPDIALVGNIKKISTPDIEDDVENVKNVVGMIYDRYSCGLTARLDKVTAQYIANGDYTTYFHHVISRYFVDTRNNALILTLN